MQIKILATSDMHGYIMPTSYSEKKMDLPFGTAKAATMLKKLRRLPKDQFFKLKMGILFKVRRLVTT